MQFDEFVAREAGRISEGTEGHGGLMSVDMFERRFRQELQKLEPFAPNDQRDPRVWPRKGSKDAEFPAWRALFSAMCLFGHSTGYRLFSYEQFFRYCRHAYVESHPEHERFEPYFEGDLLAGMRQRIGVWYESGMAETYLYACLAEAIEDKDKLGVVLYDPRADWKLKADVIVIINRLPMRVSAYVGEQGDRPGIEAKRDAIERMRKQNTLESAHWDNVELQAMPLFEIARADTDLQTVNGVRLHSISAINDLLERLYAHAGVKGWLFPPTH
jgi:hypothetical protein